MNCPSCGSKKVHIVKKVRHQFRLWLCNKCRHSWKTEDK